MIKTLRDTSLIFLFVFLQVKLLDICTYSAGFHLAPALAMWLIINALVGVTLWYIYLIIKSSE